MIIQFLAVNIFIKQKFVMRILLVLISIILSTQVLTIGQQSTKRIQEKRAWKSEENTLHFANSEPIDNISATTISLMEIPKIHPGDIIITHTGYSLLYDETYEQADWVAYELTKEETGKGAKRTNKFIRDPQVKTGSADNSDYSGSGYDRGHMAPAGDMGWSSTSMAESFYYSNMSPQEPGFNRGIWKNLEELVRTWAVENQAIYVVTGPVLTSGLATIGNNKVAVPKYYYKVILDYTEPGLKGIGFILPNKASKEPLQAFAVTIDSVEKFTGIDFFPQLPDMQEKSIESTLTLQSWSWRSSNTANVKEKTTVNPIENKFPTDRATGKTAGGETIYTGPRGGKYHFNKSGHKVYERKLN